MRQATSSPQESRDVASSRPDVRADWRALRERAAGRLRGTLTAAASPTLLASLAFGVAAALLALSLGPQTPAARPALAPAAPVVAAEDAAPRLAPVVAREAPAVAGRLRPDEDAAGLVTPTSSPLAVALAAPLTEPEAPADAVRRPRLSERTGLRPAEEPPLATPPPTPTPRPGIVRHRVAAGESLDSLAALYGISRETIVQANRLGGPELTPGQELRILPVSGQLHVVAPGDTIVELAERYGVIPEDIVAVSRLADPDTLDLGQELVIPEVPLALRSAPPAEPQPLAKALAPVEYRVVAGDTLLGIAERFGISQQSVLWANPEVTSPDRLSLGQKLLLPPVSGVLHRVRPGDTVGGVAARYDASAAEVIRVNALAEPYVVHPGDLLVVPGGRVTQAAAAARPAAPSAAAALAAPPPAGPRGEQVVAVARRYLGYPYAWGGASPGVGFDCSGLTSYVYRQVGRPIPRDLWGQLNSGPRVPYSALQPGDLVFFQNTYTVGLSHVGIYVGGGRFLHAATPSTGVIVSGLGEAYWSARYVGASRP